MEIRLINASDKDQLNALILEFWRDHIRKKTLNKLLPFVAYKDIEKEIKWQTDQFLSKKYITYVAEKNGQIIGYISGLVKDQPDKVLDKAGYIKNWYVKDGFRKNGVGKKLWKSIEYYFRNQKCSHLLLDTFSENTDARTIYTKMGFIEENINMVKMF